ncbi:hypothetical protein HDK77DRAFT_7090 [Phyllosticta capitalensis]
MALHDSNYDTDDDSVIASFDRCSLASDEPDLSPASRDDNSTSSHMSLHGSQDDESTKSFGGGTDHEAALIEETALIEDLTRKFAASDEPAPTKEPPRELCGQEPAQTKESTDALAGRHDSKAKVAALEHIMAVILLWFDMHPSNNLEAYCAELRNEIHPAMEKEVEECEHLQHEIEDQKRAVHQLETKLNHERTVAAEQTNKLRERIKRINSLLGKLQKTGIEDEKLQAFLARKKELEVACEDDFIAEE